MAAGILVAAATGWAMWQEAVDSSLVRNVGEDFANNTWRAVRGLLTGRNVYATGAHIAGMDPLGPVAEHVPASLTWQAPFAVLPLRPALVAFTFASIAAIWAAVFVLARPRTPRAVLLVACCGAFAIVTGTGQWTLLLGQPTCFMVLGLALVVRARSAWIAALGFLLAASTFQTGVPLALALIALGSWPVVWRGAALVAVLSIPPVVLGVSAAGGALPFARTFTSGVGTFAVETSHRIDLGALLHRAGIHSTQVQIAVGLAVLACALAVLARLPPSIRRLDQAPVLNLVVAATLLCTYHEPYDMLLIAGTATMAVVQYASTRYVPMLAAVTVGGIGVGLSGDLVDPVCLVLILVLSAWAARRATTPSALDAPTPIAGRHGGPLTDLSVS